MIVKTLHRYCALPCYSIAAVSQQPRFTCERSERQYQGILKVVEHLSSGADSHEIRERAGVALLKLLNADYFASFIWNPEERRFADHVFINMDAQNLQRRIETAYF